jgi:hypothetical protein|tara:strand:- start:1013 stop:1564 length:552 start_codon:yes stop_codon:yes gene_type:complete
MNLFEIENNVVIYSPQALMLEPFKKIWQEDKSEDKIQANLIMSYVYYMADERSDFMHILNVDERMQAIKEALQLPEDFNGRSEELIQAMKFYEKLSETTSTKLLQSTRLVLQKISEFLDNINLNERDERSNKPIHDIGKITGSVEKIPKLIRAINEIEKEVVKEKTLKAQSGTKDISMFDLGM